MLLTRTEMTARVDHLDSEQIKIRPNIRFLFLFVVFFFSLHDDDDSHRDDDL